MQSLGGNSDHFSGGGQALGTCGQTNEAGSAITFPASSSTTGIPQNRCALARLLLGTADFIIQCRYCREAFSNMSRTVTCALSKAAQAKYRATLAINKYEEELDAMRPKLYTLQGL